MRKTRNFAMLCLLLQLGCSEDRIFEAYQEVNKSNWGIEDTLNFEFKELVITKQKTLIAVRFNESYAYSNFYVRVISYDSSSKILENRLINLPLFNSKSGKPLGKGIGSTYTKYDTIPFTLHPKTKKLALLQYMRTDELQGIESMGIKILK